jgi:hypothetical protein
MLKRPRVLNPVVRTALYRLTKPARHDLPRSRPIRRRPQLQRSSVLPQTGGANPGVIRGLLNRESRGQQVGGVEF